MLLLIHSAFRACTALFLASYLLNPIVILVIHDSFRFHYFEFSHFACQVFRLRVHCWLYQCHGPDSRRLFLGWADGLLLLEATLQVWYDFLALLFLNDDIVFLFFFFFRVGFCSFLLFYRISRGNMFLNLREVELFSFFLFGHMIKVMCYQITSEDQEELREVPLMHQYNLYFQNSTRIFTECRITETLGDVLQQSVLLCILW